MAYKDEQLDLIYRRTSGRCHLCQKMLSRKNYNRSDRKGAWHVDHSVPRSKGGTDHLNNLKAACIECNRQKSDKTTRAARSWNGKTRAPLSFEQRKQAKSENTFFGALGGGAVGFALGGLAGALVGVLAGGHCAGSINPDG